MCICALRPSGEKKICGVSKVNGEEQWRTILTHTHRRQQQETKKRMKNNMSRCNVIAHDEIWIDINMPRPWRHKIRMNHLIFRIITSGHRYTIVSYLLCVIYDKKLFYLSTSFGNRKKLKCLWVCWKLSHVLIEHFRPRLLDILILTPSNSNLLFNNLCDVFVENRVSERATKILIGNTHALATI